MCFLDGGGVDVFQNYHLTIYKLSILAEECCVWDVKS